MSTSLNHPQTEDPRLHLVERFFSGTGPSYDTMVHYATFGIDRRWKRRILAQVPSGATRILDLASGTGILTRALTQHVPCAEVVGVELREEYLEVARKNQSTAALGRVSFHLVRAEDFTSETPFDCVVSSYLAKYAELPRLAAAAASWLKPGGAFVAHDFTLPPHAWLRRIWYLYFSVLQTFGAPVLPAWREIFYGLPRLIEETQWVTELPAALKKEGFQNIRLEYLTLSGSALLTATAPSHATGLQGAQAQGG